MNFSGEDIKIGTNVPNKIFRLSEVKLVFNTYNYKNGKKNQRNAIVGVSNSRI